MLMMCLDAMDAANVLDSGHGALTSAGWKPGNAGHLHRMEHIDQPSDQLAMHRIREQRLGALIPNSSAASLQSMLNVTLCEHVYLAAAATGAALGGRPAEFQAAAGALDANSIDLAKAIGAVYGAGAEQAFLPLWRKHIGFAVDYTLGIATKDNAKQDKAVADLVQYTQDFGAFLSSANPHLPKDVVANPVKTHVLTLKGVIDAQASGDVAQAYMALRRAADDMAMIANPLADAIAKQFPAHYAI
jgi:hypothetical protein